MRTDELAEAMHETAVVSVPNLEEITRRGRGIARRRRAVMGIGAVAVTALVSVPMVVLAGGAEHGRAQVATQARTFAPGAPVGEVIETDSKFYFDRDPHAGSLGFEAVWAEAGEAPGRLSFGFRKEGTRQVLRAGQMSVPDVSQRAVDLPPMPGQHGEPTYVGIMRLPDGVAADRFTVGVLASGPDKVLEVRQEGDVLPGYLVFTVAATAELDGAEYRVTNRRGRTVARGGFAPAGD